MADQSNTASVKLITIIAPSTVRDTILEDLRGLGVTGYTTMTVNGWGKHGARHFGFDDEPNVRIDTLVSADVARLILERMDARSADSGIVAFSMNAEAVPRRHFI